MNKTPVKLKCYKGTLLLKALIPILHKIRRQILANCIIFYDNSKNYFTFGLSKGMKL
jgi:hypothetical protein